MKPNKPINQWNEHVNLKIQLTNLEIIGQTGLTD